ncbi:uncharacterized protein MELLADRAFT_123743 [Melampsora larici-populina 98AG31]|uniref:Secreted protein n=1 Tax=Melampsora larici-populina (strain 98AG31 / pathotype 3-4-7) TaxID=747676 RepID=F4RSU5_MELLP|nr:uncharacterized protein MELLADRAFT_123743 [Melampsora larici-populina 98AG31]EGG04391.1 secreted protein [Melampsora larici-populina 98AG31]
MNLFTRHYVMLIFIVLSLVTHSKQVQGAKIEDVWCQWGYSNNEATKTTTCDDGNYSYGFPTELCHNKNPGQPIAGVDCKDGNIPAYGITCTTYGFVKDTPLSGHYDCGLMDATLMLRHFQCGGLNNIPRCAGAPTAKHKSS